MARVEHFLTNNIDQIYENQQKKIHLEIKMKTSQKETFKKDEDDDNLVEFKK